MIKACLLPEALQIEPALVVYFTSHYPSAHGLTGEFDTVPWAPTRFRDLLLVSNRLLAIQIDKHKISIIARRNPTFVDNVPNSCWRIAHPMNHLLERTSTLIHHVEHQGERILDGGNPRRRGRVGLQ